MISMFSMEGLAAQQEPRISVAGNETQTNYWIKIENVAPDVKGVFDGLIGGNI